MAGKKVKEVKEVKDITAPGPLRDPVNDVYTFLIDGHSNSDIIEYLAGAGIEGHAAQRVFEKAIDNILKSTRLPAAVRLGWCLEAYLSLYNKMKTTGDYAGAMRAVLEISKLSEATEAHQQRQAGPSDEMLNDDIKTYLGDIIDQEMEIQWKE